MSAPPIDTDATAPATRPARAPRPPRTPKPPKPPRVVRRPPRSFQPLTPQQRFVRTLAGVVAIVALSFLISVMGVSHLRHAVSQQQLDDTLRAQLVEGTAPVSEGDLDNHTLADGVPVAILEIPSLGVREIVVEGTTSAVTALGPGHRRDTVLPGQQGVSLIYGRAAAYGGPFGRIQTLPIGALIRVTTGQGEHEFRVTGVRYPEEPTPPPLAADGSRLTLTTARGLPYIPAGSVSVDAELVGAADPRGARFTSNGMLTPAQRLFGIDTSTVWALIFALQLLVAAEIVMLRIFSRIGPRRAWIVFFPVMLLGGMWAGYQITLLLPNIL